jgi:hypothetical protein
MASSTGESTSTPAASATIASFPSFFSSRFPAHDGGASFSLEALHESLDDAGLDDLVSCGAVQRGLPVRDVGANAIAPPSLLALSSSSPELLGLLQFEIDSGSRRLANLELLGLGLP